MQRNVAQDLPSFEYEKVENKEQIGNGSYGLVCKGKYKNEIAVTKKLHGKSADDEKCFIKEARLMFSLKHDNIVCFKAFSCSPCAILMEYLCFDFSIFELPKQLSSLVDFLNYGDKIDAFGSFESDLILKMGHEISKGLQYLHSKGIVHRDLKARNILVSNQHYCNLNDEDARSDMFLKRPVVCKLADFGESRSQLIQTAAANHSKTRNVDR